MRLFFPYLPGTATILIYVLAAVIPAAVLLRYIYRHDTIEKEPMGLLLSLVAWGVASALCAGILERIGMAILDSRLDQSSPKYVVVLAFLVVAVAEEGAKLFFLRRRTWRAANFSHLFDGVVYSAAVSLGFAAFENIKYVFTYGLGVAVPRALFAIPGHLGFSVFMGVFYGRAKAAQNRGDGAGARLYLILGYLSAVFLHGFYDSCAMLGTAAASVVFYIFIVAMYVAVWRMIRRASLEDRPL